MELLSIIPPLMTLSWTTLTLIFGLLLLAWWYISNEPWLNHPPGPPSLPLVGSLPFLPDKNFRISALKLRAKYGDVIKVRAGPKTIIILCGYSTIKEALVKKGAIFSLRALDWIQQRLSGGKGIVGNNAESLQTQKRFTLHALRDHGFGKSTMDNLILDEADELVTELHKHINTKYNPNILFKKAISNVINMLAFGQRHAYDDPTFIRSMKLVERLFTFIGPASPINTFSFTRFLPGDVFGCKEFLTIVEELNAIYMKWIHEHKDAIAKGEEPSDLIGKYLMEIEKHKGQDNPEFTEDHLMHIIGDLFLAGTDTSSSTMNWIVLFLALFPNTQDKIYQEIVDVIGTERRPATSDRVNLNKTESFIAETLRRSSVAPFTLPHCTSEATTINGYHIAKGSFIAVCTHSVDMDADIWDDPETFNPDRFLNSDGKYQKREESILFSLGKRSCVGEGLARNEIFLFTISILQRFRIKLPEGIPEPSTIGTTGGIRCPEPYKVILEPREK